MRPSWMTADDYRILEYLAETNLVLSPKDLAYNCGGIGYYKAAARTRHLMEHGMLEHPEPIDGVKPAGTYRATSLGKRFVDGDITLTELRESIDP